MHPGGTPKGWSQPAPTKGVGGGLGGLGVSRWQDVCGHSQIAFANCEVAHAHAQTHRHSHSHTHISTHKNVFYLKEEAILNYSWWMSSASVEMRIQSSIVTGRNKLPATLSDTFFCCAHEEPPQIESFISLRQSPLRQQCLFNI